LRSRPSDFAFDLSKSVPSATTSVLSAARPRAARFTRFARSAPRNPEWPRLHEKKLAKHPRHPKRTLRVGSTPEESLRGPLYSGLATPTAGQKNARGEEAAGSRTSGRFVAAIRLRLRSIHHSIHSTSTSRVHVGFSLACPPPSPLRRCRPPRRCRAMRDEQGNLSCPAQTVAHRGWRPRQRISN